MTEQNEYKDICENMTEYLKNKYHISKQDACRISVLITQLKIGYTLSVYPRGNMLDEVNNQVCIIYFISSNAYSVMIDKISNLFSSKISPYENKKIVNLDEFVAICLNVLDGKDLSLSMDFDWNSIKC